MTIKFSDLFKAIKLAVRSRIWLQCLILLGFFSLIGLTSLGIIFQKFASNLPDPHILENYTPNLVTKIYDCNNEIIAEFFSEKRTLVPLTKIPVDLQNAVIAIEDKRFFHNWGMDLRGTFRASLSNLLAGRVVEGGSTITQQLAKVIFLTRKRTLERKIKELLLSLKLEKEFSKEEILQLYLNQIYFGGGAYGVEAAASVYFGKPIEKLNLPECALLAGLIRSPNKYSPLQNKELSQRRRTVVLQQMSRQKFITPEEEKEADKYPILEQKIAPLNTNGSYAVENVRQQLEAKYGTEMVYKGGLSVYTTLDLKMQKNAEEVITSYLNEFDLRKEADEAIELSTATAQAVEGALVAINPRTGEIKALVGGRDFQKSQFNRATQARRQPGSAFKVFVWTAALENGYTAASIVDDLPILFVNDGRNWALPPSTTTQLITALPDGTTEETMITQAVEFDTSTYKPEQVWTPDNWDNKFFGPITLRKGLAMSRNLVSVRLIFGLTPDLVIDYARRMGIKSSLGRNPSLGLGTSELTLLELTSAIATIANNGVSIQPWLILRVEDDKKKILEETFPVEKEAISPQLAYLITNLMRGVVENGTGSYARNLRRPAAGKTGTSQDIRDLWFTGFTPELVCTTWMGYDDFSPLGKKLSTAGTTVPMWTQFMQKALENKPVRDFAIPPNIIFAKIDAQSGQLALSRCPKAILEAFLQGTEPTEFCTWDHSVEK
ncbi:MAG: transglycosylase domain-containing protein [Elusimicrobiota bacterium]